MKYVVILAMFLQIALAVQLTPMVQTIEKANNRNVVFSVINGSDHLAASEFSVLRITGHTKDGKEIREETDNVVIYPSQFIIKATGSKKVRVSYNKRAFPVKQEVYRVIAKELPIKVEEEKVTDKIKAGVKFVFTYEGLLLVGGDQKKLDLDVGIENDDAKSLDLRVRNIGNMSGFVSAVNYKILAKTSKGNIIIDKSYMDRESGIRLLPDETFIFTIKKTKKLKGAKVTSVTFTEISQKSTKK